MMLNNGGHILGCRCNFANKKAMKDLVSIQLKCAVGLCFVGAGLLIAGFVVEPTGKIDSSVLVAFGEILTFVGALMGIDYKYKC